MDADPPIDVKYPTTTLLFPYEDRSILDVVYSSEHSTKLGGGSIATVFKYKGPARPLRMMMNSLKNRVGPDMVPRDNEEVAIRVVFLKWGNLKGWFQFIKERVKGSKFLYYMRAAKAEHPCTGDIIKGRDLVPKLYFSGISHSSRMHVTVMSIAKGKSLHAIMAEETPTPKKLPKCVKTIFHTAILACWMMRVSHADLNQYNVFYDDATRRITFIDFDHAVFLPDELVEKIRAAAAQEGQQCKNLYKIWTKSTLNSFVKLVTRQRRTYSHFSNGRIVRMY